MTSSTTMQIAWVTLGIAAVIILVCANRRSRQMLINTFVPFNVYELVRDPAVAKQFPTLVQTVSNTEYAQAYDAQDRLALLTTILNSAGVGTFKVVSVGEMRPFTFFNVTLQDTDTLDTAKFERIDFLIENESLPASTTPTTTPRVSPPSKGTLLTTTATFSSDPAAPIQSNAVGTRMTIKRVILTPPFDVSKLQTQEELRGSGFEIKNPLHLFYPFKTSQDDMALGVTFDNTSTATPKSEIAFTKATLPVATNVAASSIQHLR